jgi:hypothetical protein
MAGVTEYRLHLYIEKISYIKALPKISSSYRRLEENISVSGFDNETLIFQNNRISPVKDEIRLFENNVLKELRKGSGI